MSYNATDWEIGSINSTNYTKGTINNTFYGEMQTRIRANSTVILANSTVINALGIDTSSTLYQGATDWN
jgi:hypothetical protein